MAPHLARFSRDERGTISLISMVTLLFFLLLICYVGNVGNSVREKMELQNAADATAYSIALWQARSMNAVTTCNHMLGEATAVVVMLESFGGKLLEEGGEFESDESKNYNRLFKKGGLLRENAAPIGYFSNQSTFIHTIDSRIIDGVCDDLLAKDEGKHYAGAMIYDAKLTLKYANCVVLTIKNVASLVSLISYVPYFQWVDIPCIGVHVAASAILVKIGQEWAYLEGMEKILKPTQPVKKLLESDFIPALSNYSKSVVKIGPLSAPGPINQGAMSRAAESSLEQLQSRYQSRGFELHLFPDVRSLKLPIEPESPPPAQGSSSSDKVSGNWEMPDTAWKDGSNKYFTAPGMRELDQLQRRINRLRDNIDRTVGRLLRLMNSDLNPLKIAGLSTGALEDFQDELEKITRLPKFEGPDYSRGYPENPSHNLDEDYHLPEFYWKLERDSQWVRATYPYVNSFRAPMVNWMRDGLGLFSMQLSNAATYYVHWSDRYTLARSYEIRSGVNTRFGDPPAMYVMQGSSPTSKGYEEWTRNELKAEGLFALYAFASHEREKPIFASVFYKNPNRGRSVAISSAIFYNANGSRLPSQQPQGRQRTQVDTGWDTLNWEDPVKAREWGGVKPDKQGSRPWSLFNNGLTSLPDAKAKVNWQAKLVPINVATTPSVKLMQALLDPELPEEVKEQIKQALKSPLLIHH